MDLVAILDGFSHGLAFPTPFQWRCGHEVTVIQQLPGHEARRLWRVGQRRQQHGAAAERRGTVPCGWATGLVMEKRIL